MKQVLILLSSLLLTGSVFSQSNLYSSGKFTEAGVLVYDSVILAPDVSKAELFKRASAFVATHFNSDKSVTMNDTAIGVLKIQGNAEYVEKIILTKTPYRVYFTIQILFKDGKCKYSITDIQARAESSSYQFMLTDKLFNGREPKKSAYISGAVVNLNLLAQDLEKSLTSAAKVDTNF